MKKFFPENFRDFLGDVTGIYRERKVFEDEEDCHGVAVEAYS